MIEIIFIGDSFHNRFNTLSTIDNCVVTKIDGTNVNDILMNIPSCVIDLFVIDTTKSLYKNVANEIKNNLRNKHVPIISLITQKELHEKIFKDGDLFVTDIVSNIEFKYYTKSIIKMKLMDDELKKDKIVLELKVKERTKELEKANEIAEQSIKIKNTFISNISHEIRTPMNSIIGFTSLLEYEKDPKKIKTYINIIINSGDLLINLIDDIMDLSKMETGNMKIKFKSFDLHKLLNDLNHQFLKYSQNRNKTNLILKQDIPTKNTLLYSDPKRIYQILNNLLSNAIKFTKYGRVNYGYNINNKEITFFVKDTGIGIKKENINKIFDRFYQIDRDKVKKQEGTGLGLTISKTLIELMGGKICVKSTYKKGTNIQFTLPLHKKKIEYKIPIKTPCKNLYEDKKVLILEENDTNYQLLKIILLSTKLKVDRAKTHIEFYDIINNEHYDLIILDIQTSNYKGWGVLEWLHENKKDIPNIVQTACTNPINYNRAMKLGTTKYFTKPINATDLLKHIHNLCEKRK